MPQRAIWQYQQLADPVYVPPRIVPSVDKWLPVVPDLPRKKARLSASVMADCCAFVQVLPPPPALFIEIPSVPIHLPKRLRVRNADIEGGFFYDPKPIVAPNPNPPPGPPPPIPLPPAGAFTQVIAATVVAPVGQPPLAYLVRADQFQIAALDTKTPSPVDFALYQCHSFTGDAQSRNSRKKVWRVKVFGSGSIPTTPNSAYMVVTADGGRTDVYAYSAQSGRPDMGLLWSQGTMALVGRRIDIALFLTGTGLSISEVIVEYTPVD